MGDVMKEAAFSLAEVKFSAGDVSQYVLESAERATLKVSSRKENVAGTNISITYNEAIT